MVAKNESPSKTSKCPGMKLLMKYGPDVDAIDNNGVSVLGYSLRAKNQYAKMLVSLDMKKNIYLSEPW